MPWIDTELSPQFKNEIESFPQTVLPKVYELLEQYKDGKMVVVFKSREQADAFLSDSNSGLLTENPGG